MVDDAVRRVFALSRQDIYFIIIILMLAVNMAFNFSLVEPVRNIQEAIKEEQEKEIRPLLEDLRDLHNSSEQIDCTRVSSMITKNTLSLILLAFAAGLLMSSVTTWAQEGTNVTTPEGTTEEVPTLSEMIQTNLQSLTALIAAIIALVGLVVKSGILNPWISKKKQEQFYTGAQQNFVTMKKALEDKTLTKFVL